MRGVRQRPASWRELLGDDERVGLLVPMMLLAHEHDPDPSLRPPPIDPDKREKALELMIASLPAIYRYFEPQRRALARASSPMPQRQARPKVGRNEPCPCGSGRKYKRCCGANAPTLHQPIDSSTKTITDHPYPAPPRQTLADLDPESTTTDALIEMVRQHREGEAYPTPEQLHANLPVALRALCDHLLTGEATALDIA